MITVAEIGVIKMTYEEAKAIMGNLVYLYRLSGDRLLAWDMAIEALEKQIPEIPDYEGDGYADGFLVYDTWICPCCGRHYEVDYDDYKYCPECGQRIDWSTLATTPKNVPFNPLNHTLSDFYAKVV